MVLQILQDSNCLLKEKQLFFSSSFQVILSCDCDKLNFCPWMQRNGSQNQKRNVWPGGLLSAFLLSLPSTTLHRRPLINARSLTRAPSVHVGLSPQRNYLFSSGACHGTGRTSPVLQRCPWRESPKKPENHKRLQTAGAKMMANKWAWSHRSPPRCVESTPEEAVRPTVIPQEWTVALNGILTWWSQHWKTSNWNQAAVIHSNKLEIGDY